MTKITNNTDTSTNTPMTHEEAMALPKQQFIDRCNAWLDEFNDGNQLKIDDPQKCPIHVWVVHNHQACCKDLVGGITNCEICGKPMCPDCSNHGVTQLSRVTGYIQDVAGFNAGKKQELADRKKHDTFGSLAQTSLSKAGEVEQKHRAKATMHENKIVEKGRTGDNTMDKLRIKVKDLLIKSKESMTIPQICKNLNIDDEYDVLSAIAELENINEVALNGMKKFYQPDGCVAYLAEYGCVG